MAGYDLRDVDAGLCVGGNMPTTRPISRPRSARASRRADAVQYHKALCQVMADQATSIQDARFSRYLAHVGTQANLQEQSEAKELHIAAFKDQQRQWMAERSERYFAEDLRRSNEWESKKKRAWCTDAMAEKSEMRALSCDLKRRRNQQSERYGTCVEHVRALRAQFDATQQRAELLDEACEQRRQESWKKTERMEAFRDAEERRFEEQRKADLAKEMRRKEGRLLQLMRDRITWQAACSFREVAPQELIVHEKFLAEKRHLGGVSAQMQQLRRPKSANATSGRGVCPRTGGIPAFSNTSRSSEIEALRREAVKHGPPVSVINPRIGCV